jgi:hypothetical protein
MNRLLAIVLLILPVRSWAALFCIADAADFYQVLQIAATTLEDDDIRLASGLQSGLGNETVLMNGDLSISGGWGGGCFWQLLRAIAFMPGLQQSTKSGQISARKQQHPSHHWLCDNDYELFYADLAAGGPACLWGEIDWRRHHRYRL